MAAANKAPIVVKKIKKGGGHGHHGGAWKVAYADFVTAMMAFFLLMWLINTTSPDQRRGIAEFFAPASVSRTSSGSGGLLQGTAFDDEGVKHNMSAPVTPPSDPHYTTNDRDAQNPDANTGEQSPAQDALDRARTIRENAQFSRAEAAIRQAMQDLPDVAELSRHIIMDQTPEGLRIQIIDQEGRSMFDRGSTQLNDRARLLLRTISGAIARLPNRLMISGHTDGAPAAGGGSNWELSAARANSARRQLESLGISGERIYQVAGKADSEPLFPDDPTLPGNRRIEITLMREAPPLPPGYQLAP